MNNFLIRHFIKDYENTKDPAVRDRYGRFAGTVGIISNLILCAIKVIIGFVSSSIAIIADGINNLSDASSSVITLVGFKLAQRPGDDDHPFGHARIEYITGLFVSVIIIVVGLLLLKSSAIKILHPEVMDLSMATIVVLIVAIAGKFWQATFYNTLGKKIDSVALLATGTDSRNDVISTAVVLLGVIITKTTGFNLDGFLGCLVALFIIYSGIELVKETSSPLLGEAPSEELVTNITNLVLDYDGVLGMHDLVVHNYGPGNIFASIHVEVDAAVDVMISHDLIDNIEREVGQKLMIEFVIHMDPIKTDDPVINKVRPILANCTNIIDGVSEFHDLRAVVGKTHTNIIFDLVISNDCKLSESEITEIYNKNIKGLDPSYFVVINFDKEYATFK